MKFQLKIYIAALFIMLIAGCAAPIKNGFVQNSDGHTYYYVDGEMQTGWQEIGDDVYYFYPYYKRPRKHLPYGCMFQGLTILEAYKGEGEHWYMFSDEGKMLKNHFAGLYYFGEDGAAITDTEMEIDGIMYSFDSEGEARRLYSFPALGRGNYNFTISNVNWGFSHEMEDEKWTIEGTPTVEVHGKKFVIISGVISLRSKDYKSHNAMIWCRLSAKDAEGITSSVKELIQFSSIKNGEKTRFKVEFINVLPIDGTDIDIDFEY